ncbi:MAG TPA: glucokinase, partial [Rubrivivax sp.]
MTEGYPRLLGDIGGTHARWAWQAAAGAPLQDIVVRPCSLHPSIEASAHSYLTDGGHPRPAWVAIGIATPVAGDRVSMTNSPWSFSIAELQRSLGARRCLVINDFTALAMSLPALGADDLCAIGGGQAVAGAAIGLLGAGTGLGVSGLQPLPGGGWAALSGEGGHVTLAPADDADAEILAILRRRFGHVSAERVLSGPGLVNLHDAICARDGAAAGTLQPADVVRAAVDTIDKRSVEAARLFASFLGNVAGNLALTLGAL